MKFLYQIHAWNIEEGEKVELVALSIEANSEEQAKELASEMALRTFYDTVTVEQAPVENNVGS